MDFVRLQFAVSSRSQTSQLQRPELNSLQSQYLVSNSSHQTADFTVLAFLKFHLQNRALAFATMNMHIAKLKETFGEVHALAKLLQCVRMRNPGDMTTVATNDFKTRMSQSLREIAIVRDQQHALSHLIKTTDGKHSLFGSRHQINGFGTSLRIMIGAQKALGLVNQKIAKPRHPQSFRVQPDVLLQRIDGASRVRHHFRIHGHSPGADVFFAFATRINAGHGEKLL